MRVMLCTHCTLKEPLAYLDSEQQPGSSQGDNKTDVLRTTGPAIQIQLISLFYTRIFHFIQKLINSSTKPSSEFINFMLLGGLLYIWHALCLGYGQASK
jgi:hypothetical protein